MTLARAIRSAVKTARSVALRGDVLKPITIQRWTGVDTSGDDDHAAAETFYGVVEEGLNHIYTAAGTQVPVIGRVTILEPIEDNGASYRREPIDPRDVVTLPSGATGPAIVKPTVVDGGTGSPYMFEIWVGK